MAAELGSPVTAHSLTIPAHLIHTPQQPQNSHNPSHNSFFLWKNLRRYISWNTADVTHTASEKMLNQATRVLVSSARAQVTHAQARDRRSRGWGRGQTLLSRHTSSPDRPKVHPTASC